MSVWQALNEADALDQYSVISAMGADLSKYQIHKLMLMTDTVILFLDNDPAGWSGNLEVARKMQDLLLLCAVKYPSPLGGDPADLYKEGVDIVEMIKNADLLISAN